MKTMLLGLQAYVQASRAACGVLGWRVGQPAGLGRAGEEARADDCEQANRVRNEQLESKEVSGFPES